MKYSWVFDFDGTLSDLTDQRKDAVLNTLCKKMLKRLAETENQIVAIISSRTIDDLIHRVRIKGIVLAGGSGMEILLPNGQRLAPNEKTRQKVSAARARILPVLQTEFGQIPGVDIEDKRWSIAVHFRHTSAPLKRYVGQVLPALTKRCHLQYFHGPEAFEIPLFHGHSKVRGLRNLIRLYPGEITPNRLTIAGDDQNDLEAMNWIKARDGNCLIVGGAIKLRGARRVSSPDALAREVLARLQRMREIKGAILQ